MNEDTRQELCTLETLANPFRYKTGLNADGEANIFGYNGVVEWHSFDNQTFGAFTTKPKTIKKLLSLPWVKRHQQASAELRVLFPRDRFSEMADILKLKKKRPVPKPETLEAGLKGLQEWREAKAQVEFEGLESTYLVKA